MRSNARKFTEAELMFRQEYGFREWLNRDENAAARVHAREQHRLEDEAIEDEERAQS